MAGNEYPRPGDIRANIRRLRLEAAWYRRRLQETYDRLTVLEHTGVDTILRCIGQARERRR